MKLLRQWGKTQPNGDGAAAYWSSDGTVSDTLETKSKVRGVCVQEIKGSISTKVNSGCPSSLRVVSANSLIQGNYEITNQTRRGQPVWYNKEKNMFLLVAKDLRWHIKPAQNYIADDNVAHAYSEATLPVLSGKVWCPQNLVYMVWTNGKWTKAIMVFGKIKFDLYVKVRAKFFLYKVEFQYKPLFSIKLQKISYLQYVEILLSIKNAEK